MKKSLLSPAIKLPLLFVLLILSAACKSSAPSPEDGNTALVADGAANTAPEAGEAENAEEGPDYSGAAGENIPAEENTPSNGDIDGESDDKPEIAIPPEPLEEIRPSLPEPQPPVLPPPLPPSPSIPDQRQEPEQSGTPSGVSPADTPVQEAPEQNIPSQQQPPPAAPREPPAPPAFLRPAEPESLPPARPPSPVAPAPAVPAPVPSVPAPDLQSQDTGASLPALPERKPPAGEEEPVVFSRVVRATVGQIIEIPFRGTGWVYLGELGNRRGISYDSRKLDLAAGTVEGQSFIFRAEAPGTYILKFYKQDFIQDYIINDYVQVIVGDASENSGAGRFGYPVDRDRVIAEPRWPLSQQAAEPGSAGIQSLQGISASPDGQNDPNGGNSPPAVSPDSTEPAAQMGSSAAAPPAAAPPAAPLPAVAPPAAAPPAAPPPAAPGIAERPRQSSPDDSIVAVAPPQAANSTDSAQTGAALAGAIPPDAPPSEYVRQAKQEFDAGRVDSALSIMEKFKQNYPSGTDEAWWLYGQLLEANSASKDVRQALDYYRRLIREYPQSPRVTDAQRRIAYLERYYLNIR